MGSFYILVLLGAISLTSANELLRYILGHADCRGVPYGWLVRNPLDCGSYFVCEEDIKYEQCPNLLHFDAEQRVCNWPNKAKCDWTALPSIIIPEEFHTSHFVPTQKPEITTTIKHIETTTKPITVKPTTTTQKPQPTTTHKSSTHTSLTNLEDIFGMKWVCENVIMTDTKIGEIESELGAYDKELGKKVDPMTSFDPRKVSCLFDGVYFLPHPTACHNFYICAHRTLIAHSCGNGVYWNFQTNQCDLSQTANCYKKDNIPHQFPPTKPPTPPTEGVTRYVPPVKPTTTLNEKVPICPLNVQTYYPHSEDCRKYYICIAGLPVLTTCPDELYWDDSNKFCGLPKYTECKAKKV